MIYWPGRGDGVFGVGSRECPRGEGADRYIEMESPPAELSPELDGVYLSDVDMDGTDDVVQVRFREVDVWFNRAGQGWTARTTARDTPVAPAFAPRVRFADLDGSATTDIVWANAGNYEYLDPTGGQRPRLLIGVHNGLGAQTSIEYGSSAEDYVRDLAASGAETFDWSPAPSGPDTLLCELSGQSGSAPCTGTDPAQWLLRSAGSPVVSTVVRAVSTTDNFAALGLSSQVSESRFSYHDGYYEGIEQEFRGFGAADATTVGDWNNPTVHSRTWFHQGRRPSELEGDRLADNPNEALKGREYLTEVLDDSGAYLSTSFATMTNRRLATGLDGRAIHFAYVYETNELRYDTSPFVAGSSTLELDLVLNEAVNPSTGAPGTASVGSTRTLAVRGDAAYASRIRTRWLTVLNVGFERLRREDGRRGVLNGNAIDDYIDSITYTNVANDDGQWLWYAHRTEVQDDPSHPLDNEIYRRTWRYVEPDRSRMIAPRVSQRGVTM